ncbi:hypothetical protein ACGFZR_00680 [Streptomyces sp. NPDC048241]|uniref:hypothetical protein n=1 Tax=Streptomyces sp. NPDC048241 TaxID=3365521 RepID=UPI00372124F7
MADHHPYEIAAMGRSLTLIWRPGEGDAPDEFAVDDHGGLLTFHDLGALRTHCARNEWQLVEDGGATLDLDVVHQWADAPDPQPYATSSTRACTSGNRPYTERRSRGREQRTGILTAPFSRAVEPLHGAGVRIVRVLLTASDITAAERSSRGPARDPVHAHLERPHRAVSKLWPMVRREWPSEVLQTSPGAYERRH